MKKVTVLASLLLSHAVSAQVFEYTNTETGDELIPLGYPVPLPIDSLLPIDGFRTYQSLDLRHQQLSEQSELVTRIQVGQTIDGLPIWAYQLGDEDQTQSGGGTEGTALINGGIHAREWQSPEAVTGFIETLFDNRQDEHLSQYILENLQVTIIPVLNIDGFLQTQRFPAQVTDYDQSPRDGRMRRKNMNGVDRDLETTADNLNGIDLNRNNNPFWASTPGRSSDDPTSIVHHGDGPASEPETQALIQAALEAGEDRLRFYTDVHSFTQIYFTPMTGNARRDLITADLATIMRAANEFRYRYGPSAAGGGIGTTDEYFANTYQIPSYTLEIEPLNSGADYGGFGVSHDGFILPASEVARMRGETARATLSGLYTMSDVPFLQGVDIVDEQGNTVIAQQWQAEGQTRLLETSIAGELVAGQPYVLRARFNKPMRWLEEDQVTNFANLSEARGIAIRLVGEESAGTQTWEVDADAGEWQVQSGYARYRTDTYEAPFTLPESFDWQQLSRLAVEVTTTDFAGQALDANPATVVDWSGGSWRDYEDTQGNADSDEGGTDQSMRLIDDGSPLFAPAAPPPAPAPAPVAPAPTDSGGSGGGGALSPWLLLMLGLVLTFVGYKKSEH